MRPSKNGEKSRKKNRQKNWYKMRLSKKGEKSRKKQAKKLVKIGKTGK